MATEDKKKQEQKTDPRATAMNATTLPKAETPPVPVIKSDNTSVNFATIKNSGESSTDPIHTAIQKSYEDMGKSFADYMQDYKDIYDRQQQESRLEEEGQRKAAVWSGATEFATAIANMVGVGSFGASHQQYQPHSADWMTRADAERKERKSKLGASKQRLAELKLRQNELKQKGIQTLAEYDYKKRQLEAQNALKSIELQRKALMDENAQAYRQNRLMIDAYNAETNRQSKLGKGNDKKTAASKQDKTDPIDALLGL